jgi:uncharacterized protein (TIRG00374 family)
MNSIQTSEKMEGSPIKFNWKIWIPVIFGLLIATWLLMNAVSEVKYYKTLDEKGEFIWIDANENNIVDFSDPNDFKKSVNGNYSQKTFTDAIGEIQISTNTILFFVLALVMMFCRDFGYMIRIRYLTDKKLSWKQSFRVIMIWEFASAMTPGIVGGAAVAMFILKREGINLGKSTAIVLITALLDELFYILIVPVTILLVGTEAFFPNEFTTDFFGWTINPFTLFLIAFSIIFLIVLFLLVAIFIAPYWFKKFLLFFCKLFFLKKFKSRLEKTGDDIIIASKEFKGKPISFWGIVFGATVFSWMGRFMVINCIIWAFSPMADQLLVFARQLSMWVILLISPTPGGSGIAEFAFSGFLNDFIPFGFVAILAILWRLISYYPYLFIGAIILPRWLRNKNQK